ncbi:ricin-type beta-trefoil lectin domain protein [Lentzea albida]|uniref:Subtilase family protein n=1 Tax=Lentzea albida TaxID=65499 RepID=A0A1H9VZX8_9PSEU|nr:ricin-type beta-trefoil lectin domain protein [Lentzea albida]SES27256.1 Subtilase family protein [Lentzea albida]
MRRTRRVAVAAACLTLGVAGAVSPVQAAPGNGARPDVVNSARHVVGSQDVAKDAQGRMIVYVEGAQESSLRAAVAKAGGVVADADAGRVKAVVPQDKLDVVASQAGVTEVRLPDRAVPMGVTSEGVVPSRANEWISAGKTGAGVKVGIIDVGFGDLAASQAAGELPATGPQLAYRDAGCLDATTKSVHGTNVAETVHDMAPGAELYLACVEDSVSFSAAADWMDQQGVKIISSAVGFLSPSGGRGDGSGPQDSPADVVKRSRAKGVLWNVAAGNLARTHFAGTPVVTGDTRWVKFRNDTQFNQIILSANQSATISIRWDAWPTTNEDLDLYVMDQMIAPDAPNAPAPRKVSLRSQKDAQGGLSPTEEVQISNTAASSRPFYVYVKNNNARFTTPFELFVAGPEQIQYWTEAGSITEPATSPHVLAVGATQPGSGQVEDFSGRGPTIDGRTKPDIIGFDRTSTSMWPAPDFRGTSAATAHVAGAAALLKSANPALDATQLQSALQGRAVRPANADPNTWGSGVLNVGAATNVPTAPAGSKYTADPVPTRTVAGQVFAAGETRTIPFSSLPSESTAVAITVSVRANQDSIGEFGLEIAQGDPAVLGGKVPTIYGRGENSWTWTTMTLFAPLDGARSIKMRNRGNGPVVVVVERLGYFHPNGVSTFTALKEPARVLDTRGFPVVTGGSTRKTPLIGANDTEKTVDVPVRGVGQVPTTATSVVVNLTGFEATQVQFLVVHAGGTSVPVTTSLVLGPGERRSNLVVVPIGADGKIRLTNTSSGYTAGAALDVVGWFADGDSGARYVPFGDVGRVADTATGNGVPKALIGHGQSAAFQVTGTAGIPDSATTAAMVLTGRDDNLGTELSAVSKEVGWLPASQVSTRKAEPASGLALVPLGSSGEVRVRNERGQTKLSADVTGYFVGSAKVTGPASDTCVTAADEPGFTSILDGRSESDLAGWRSTGTKMTADRCEAVTANTSDVNWYTAHTYNSDYTLKVDWKATTNNSDSGVFVGITNPGTNAAAPGQSGYEINIGPTGATGTMQTGGVVGIKPPLTTTAVKPVNQWNTFKFVFRWNTVTVYLNDTLVNEHGFSDATAASRNTFIGLQNDNTGDPVRFRNVRIKRDTPVLSGVVKNSGGRCLDMFNADPNQSVVELFTCHGGFAQVWTMHGGLVLAGGRCLRAAGTTDGTEAVLGGCAGDDFQQWTLRGDNRLVHRQSGRCLTPRSNTDLARLELRACNLGDASQTWVVPEANGGRVGQIVAPVGKCIDIFNSDVTQNRIGVHPCHGGLNQSWVMTGDGTVRGSGKCLNIASNTPGEGSAVNVADCNGSQHQQWLAQQEGTLVNPLTGRCLASAGGEFAPLLISTCNGTPAQSFRLSSQVVSVGQVVGLATKCVDVFGGTTSGKVNLHTCVGSSAHNWWSTGDGTLRALGSCLDIQSTANAALTVLAGCRGDGGQIWSARHDGTIVNPMSNRCLDVFGALPDDGTQIIIGDCHGGPNQRWATPVNPS